MERGAQSPEELETLFEDALLMRDREALSRLFRPGAVLAGSGIAEARGEVAIARAADALCAVEHGYVGGARRVLQARDTALVVSATGLHVARRDPDGAWRVAISLLHPANP